MVREAAKRAREITKKELNVSEGKRKVIKVPKEKEYPPLSIPMVTKCTDWYQQEIKAMQEKYPKVFHGMNPWLSFNSSRIEHYRSLGWLDGTERGMHKCHYHSHCEWLKIQLEEYRVPITRSKCSVL